MHETDFGDRRPGLSARKFHEQFYVEYGALAAGFVRPSTVAASLRALQNATGSAMASCFAQEWTFGVPSLDLQRGVAT